MSMKAEYFAFGDSLTAGTGDLNDKGFVSIYHNDLEQKLGKSIHLVKSGTEGATTGELLIKLRDDPSIRTAVKQAKLITITAGGNDLMQAAIPFFMEGQFHHLTTALRSFVVNSRQIVSTIHEMKAESREKYLVLFIGLYNPLANIPIADKWVRRFNRYSASLQRDGVIYVNVYNGFLRSDVILLSDDLVHPNGAGYLVIAAHISQSVPISIIKRIFEEN